MSAADALAEPDPPGPVRHVYVHVPFRAREPVDDRPAVHVDPDPDLRGWLETLAGEWRLARDDGRGEVASALATLYVGGGSPSLLGAGVMAGVRRTVGDALLGGGELEWTAEADPGSFTPELAAGWREAGVTRLSLDVGSLHPGTLRRLRRLHRRDHALGAVEAARDAGIEELDVELAFAVPGASERPWRDELEAVVGLGVSHVSLRDAGGRVPGGAGEEARHREEYLVASRVLVDAGYRHYEVTSFARPGRESGHNRTYWTGRPYLGLGNGAHSYLPPVRRWNLRDWEAYRSAVRRGESPVAGEETPGPAGRRIERIWLRLRSDRGLEVPLPEGALPVARRWVREGWAELDEERLALTPRGWLLLDDLVVELDRAISR